MCDVTKMATRGATRSLEKTAISWGFKQKLRIFGRWKELYAYEAHVELAIQFPIGSRCCFCRGSDPSTIKPSNSLPHWIFTRPYHPTTTPLGSLELAVGPVHPYSL